MAIIRSMLQRGVPNFTTLPENTCCLEVSRVSGPGQTSLESKLVPQLISILIRSRDHAGGFRDIVLCFLHQFSRGVARENEHRLQNQLLQRLGLCSSSPPRRTSTDPSYRRTMTQTWFSAAAWVWMSPWHQVAVQAIQIFMVPAAAKPSDTNTVPSGGPDQRNPHGPHCNRNHGHQQSPWLQSVNRPGYGSQLQPRPRHHNGTGLLYKTLRSV